MHLISLLQSKAENQLLKYSLFKVIDEQIVEVARTLGRSIKVADFGAGSGHYWKSIPLQQRLGNEIAELYLIDAEHQFKNSNADAKIISYKGVVPEVLSQFEDDFFDITIALDLIEHLPFHSGMSLLYELDRITQEKSIIFTPNGFVWQPPAENNAFNAHLSGWDPKTFKKLGWSHIKGITGFKYKYGPYGIQKKRSNRISFFIYLLTLPLVYRIPKIAFSFVAIKSEKNPRITIHE